MGIDVNDLPDHVRKQIESKEGPRQTAKAKSVPQDSRMNKTEKNYSNHLAKMKLAGQILDWRHEAFNLRLADRTFYKPDFQVLTIDREIEIIEVKGYQFRDDALVKFKVAAEAMPWFRFVAVFWEDRQWKRKRILN